MMFARELFAVLGAATLLAGCGQPVCIAGLGSCDAYKLNPGGSPTGQRVLYTLTMNPNTLTLGGNATASLTSNSTKAATGACEWVTNGTGSVGGNISPDANPLVVGALCTAGFTATNRGTVIIQVKEKNSGVTSQAQITVN